MTKKKYILLATLALAGIGGAAFALAPAPAPVAYARVQGPGISGVVYLRQRPGAGPVLDVDLYGTVRGLSAGQHGMHVRENGDCDPAGGFAAAGGHLDPGPNGDPTDANHVFHAGDLPNITADANGVASFRTLSSRFTLLPGLTSALDGNSSSIVVTLNPDPEVPGASGGPIVACGVIESGVPTPLPSPTPSGAP